MKFIFLLLVIASFALTSQAQIIRGYGFKVGATLASEDWDYKLSNDFQPDSRWGLNLGVFSEFLNIPYFSIVTEFNYLQKGMEDEIAVTTPQHPDPSEFNTWETRVDYLNISVFGKFRLELGSIIPYFLIGPKVDFEINEETSPDWANTVAENFNDVMYGFKVGIGSEINIDKINLLAEILYDYDINNIYEGEYLTVTSSSVDFRIGIMF